MWFTQQPKNADYAVAAPFRFENEAVLRGTPEQIFELLAAEEPWTEWFPDMRSVRWLTPPPHGVSARREARLARGLGVRECFTEWQPGRRIAFFVEESTMPLTSYMIEDYRLAPEGAYQTRLTWLVGYRPRTVLRPLHPLLRPVFRRMFRTATDNLVAYCGKRFGDGV